MRTISAVLLLVVLALPLAFFTNCSTPQVQNGSPATAAIQACLEQFGANHEWSGETEVPVDGYTGNAMEPKISADQVVLFWNDKPPSDDAMNIHYAVKQANGRYQYIGTLPGTVAPSHLDGVPAVDASGNFYFISTRTYTSNLQTVFGGQVAVTGPNALQITNVAAADASVAAKVLGTLDMDIDVSWDGTLMFASRAKFSGKPFPDSSQLVLFNLSSRLASPNANSSEWLAQVNLPECRLYAATISNDMKELYYTVLPSGPSIGPNDFRIVVSKRNSITDPFGRGSIINGIQGQHLEGPSISNDDGGKTLFYHRLDPVTGNFKIFKVSRP